MNDYRKRSRKKGREFELNYAEFKALVTSPCWYCGGDPEERSIINPTRHKNARVQIKFLANGIDRIDSAVGYRIENCRTCCAQCNYMKLDYTCQEFIERARKIAERHP